MDKILAGVHEFRRTAYPQSRELFEQLAAKPQKPVALFITCADSRIHPNLITNTEPGDLFLIRNAGNIVPPHGAPTGGETATVEYAVEVLGVRNIIICGHSQCGAMKALLSGEHREPVEPCSPGGDAQVRRFACAPRVGRLRHALPPQCHGTSMRCLAS